MPPLSFHHLCVPRDLLFCQVTHLLQGAEIPAVMWRVPEHLAPLIKVCLLRVDPFQTDLTRVGIVGVVRIRESSLLVQALATLISKALPVVLKVAEASDLKTSQIWGSCRFTCEHAMARVSRGQGGPPAGRQNGLGLVWFAPPPPYRGLS